MIFPEPAFLYFFLPLLLALYAIVPKKGQNALLLIFSLIFYAWGEGWYIGVMLLSIGWNFWFGLLVEKKLHAQQRKQHGVSAYQLLTFCVAGNLLLLGFYKYAGFLVEQINWVLGVFSVSLPVPTLHLPIGISFFTFQALSYVVDVYRRVTPAQKSLLNLGLYISFFPQLIAGPIVRYETVALEIENRTVTLSSFAEGIRIFLVGLAKKVLLANTFAYTADQIFELPKEALTAPLAWLGICCYALQIYYDFSGYSDMGVGLGRLFGFHFPENFRTPYAATSMRDFWRRWHITLSTWFRDYLYIPLGGNKGSALRTTMNLATVFFLCGLWHGASLNFILWGLFHGLFLSLERVPGLQVVVKLPKVIHHAYVIFVVLMSWVLFRLEDMASIGWYYKSLFGFGGQGTQLYSIERYMQNDLLIALFFGILFSAPIGSLVQEWMKKSVPQRKTVVPFVYVMSDTLLILLFVLSMMRIAASQYSPFIYYRF